MKENKTISILRLFGEESLGDENGSELTQQTETGEATEMSAPDAGERVDPQGHEKEFKRLMEGEYKDLFTAYFQETFNRRFREQKEIKEELERKRVLVRAAVEHFGVEESELLSAIRTEQEKRNASTASATQEHVPSSTNDAEIHEALEEAVAAARLETQQQLLATIRARGLRPVENGLSANRGEALRGEASRLSRAQRAELAKRAAGGERIRF